MSPSSPADLAVTFRSIPRRLREAYGDDQPAAGSDLATQLAAAGRLLGTAADPGADRHGDRAAPAGRMGRRRRSTGLRRSALEVGAELRRIAADHPRRDD